MSLESATGPKPPTRADVHLVNHSLVSRNIHHRDVVSGKYDQMRDTRLRFYSTIPNLAFPDIYLALGWKHDASKRAVDAFVQAEFAGFGWARLESGNSSFQGRVEIRDKHAILFEVRHTIVVPMVPIVDMVEKLHMENRWPCVINGWLDTETDHFRAMLEWR